MGLQSRWSLFDFSGGATDGPGPFRIFPLYPPLQDLRELKRMQEELAAEIEAIQDKLKAHMDTYGMDTLLGVDRKIT